MADIVCSQRLIGIIRSGQTSSTLLVLWPLRVSEFVCGILGLRSVQAKPDFIGSSGGCLTAFCAAGQAGIWVLSPLCCLP